MSLNQSCPILLILFYFKMKITKQQLGWTFVRSKKRFFWISIRLQNFLNDLIGEKWQKSWFVLVLVLVDVFSMDFFIEDFFLSLDYYWRKLWMMIKKSRFILIGKCFEFLFFAVSRILSPPFSSSKAKINLVF